jgi:hypothetical protein
MALTATQLTRLRYMTGGIVGQSERDYLTDTELQTEYTEAGSDFDKAVVGVLRLRCAMTAGFTDVSNLEGSESRSQRHAHLCELLSYWESKTGLAGGRITAGAIDLDIDTDLDDINND